MFVNKKLRDDLVDELFKGYQETFWVEEEPKCEIIDIAEDELKNIDTEEIDENFSKVFKRQVIENFINKIYDSDDVYIKHFEEFTTLRDALGVDFEQLRVINNYLIFVVSSDNPDFLINMGFKKEEYLSLRTNSLYRYFILNMKDFLYQPKCYCDESCVEEKKYSEKELVKYLSKLGSKEYSDEQLLESMIDSLIKLGFHQNSTEIDDYMCMNCEIENEVVAIPIIELLSDPKSIVSDALKLNPDILTEVSSPTGTIMLIDTRRWYFEEMAKGEEVWYL